MMVTLSLINGIGFGLEHMSPDEGDDFVYVIVLTLAVFRICFVKE